VKVGKQRSVGGVDRTCLGEGYLVLVRQRRDILLHRGDGVQTHADDDGEKSRSDQRDDDDHRDEDDDAPPLYFVRASLSSAASLSTDLHTSS
jgi:hypothetical protein